MGPSDWFYVPWGRQLGGIWLKTLPAKQNPQFQGYPPFLIHPKIMIEERVDGHYKDIIAACFIIDSSKGLSLWLQFLDDCWGWGYFTKILRLELSHRFKVYTKFIYLTISNATGTYSNKEACQA